MLKAEQASFARLMVTPTAQNLIRVFFLREQMKKTAGSGSTIKHVHVIGAGAMGGDIAAWVAGQGLRVSLADMKAEPIAGAVKRANELYGKIIRKRTEVRDALDRLIPDMDGEGVRNADLIIEAVPEKLELKHEVFKQFEQAVAPETVLASNTSGIPITKIAEVCEHPGRVVGMHWSNPPHLIPMIEVIPGEQTSQEAVDTTTELVRRVGYHPVQEREVPGFVENRILYAILRECLDLVDRGIISPEGLDLNVRWGIGYKLAVIGPMELLDMAGLDIYNAVGSYLNKDLSTSGDVSSTIREKIDEGRLGMKTGGGIYDYTPEQIDQLRAQRAGKLVAVRKALEA
jgi:3-hydroxyacyl-CoA dehydrogenase/enoyl-CoA hydratase/3-hydroxybutyryl-CoA epimerase